MGIQTRRLYWLVTASLALSAAGNVAHAQQASPPAPAEEADEVIDDSDDIVVLAEPGDQVRIDRRTYTLRDDPAAQSTDMFDVLGKVPAVSVAPSGAVTLLGADNVTIQINGQPVPGDNLEQVLRGITGAEVERIEVITNPGAQYSAAASGGIINIITRRRVNTGFSGSIQSSYDSLGSYHLGVSPTWSQGPWSFSGGFGMFGGEQNSDFLREREIFSSGDATTEEGEFNVGYQGVYFGRPTVSYQFDEHRRVSLALDGVSVDNDIERITRTSDDLGVLSDQRTEMDNNFDNRQLIFDAQQTGALPREVLKFNGVLQRIEFTSTQDITVNPDGGPAQDFNTFYSSEGTMANARIDFERPFGEDQFLTLGTALDTVDQDVVSERETIAGPSPIADYEALLEGRAQTLAAYGTYQLDRKSVV